MKASLSLKKAELQLTVTELLAIRRGYGKGGQVARILVREQRSTVKMKIVGLMKRRAMLTVVSSNVRNMVYGYNDYAMK